MTARRTGDRLARVDFAGVALACGYATGTLATASRVRGGAGRRVAAPGPHLVHARIRPGRCRRSAPSAAGFALVPSSSSRARRGDPVGGRHQASCAQRIASDAGGLCRISSANRPRLVSVRQAREPLTTRVDFDPGGSDLATPTAAGGARRSRTTAETSYPAIRIAAGKDERHGGGDANEDLLQLRARSGRVRPPPVRAWTRGEVADGDQLAMRVAVAVAGLEGARARFT